MLGSFAVICLFVWCDKARFYINQHPSMPKRVLVDAQLAVAMAMHSISYARWSASRLLLG